MNAGRIEPGDRAPAPPPARGRPRKPIAAPSRLTAEKLARRAMGLRAYESEIRLVRGKCRGARCASRWGCVRVTLDFAMSRERIERIGTVECVACSRTWYRIAPPDVIRRGYIGVRLTLIVPNGEHHRYTTVRGAVVIEGGDESLVIANARMAQLEAAREEWRKRNGQLLASRERAKTRRAELEAAALARSRAALDALRERDAERAADEAAAAAREAAGEA